MKTSELIGPALDWAVAKADGFSNEGLEDFAWKSVDEYCFSTDWAQGGPIIEREEFTVSCEPDGRWHAEIGNSTSGWWAYGPTPLIAAMRCYVASKLGDDIDIPEELK